MTYHLRSTSCDLAEKVFILGKFAGFRAMPGRAGARKLGGSPSTVNGKLPDLRGLSGHPSGGPARRGARCGARWIREISVAKGGNSVKIAAQGHADSAKPIFRLIPEPP